MKIFLLFNLCEIALLTWALAGVLLRSARRNGYEAGALVSGVYRELRPFYIPIAVGSLLCITFIAPGVLGLLAVGAPKFAWDLWIWTLLRDVGDDDDRWKRRRRKLARKVAVKGGRLIVAPAGAR